MANTRKTTTKAKTKTTKKSTSAARTTAAKTTSATKTVKVTKKPAVKTPAVKAAAVPARKSTGVTANMLRRLNFIKAVVFAALAVAAGMLMDETRYPLSVGHQAKDELLGMAAQKTELVHASQNIMDIEIRWVVVTIMAIAAILSLLAATRLRRKFEATLDDGVSTMRWIGWGITSALIVETIAILSGVSDIFVLKLVAGLMLITCTLAWITEKRNKQAGRPVWSEFVLGLFTGSLPWLLIASYAVSTWVWGLVRYPWYVYALYAVVIAGFTLLTLNQYKRILSWRNTLIVERNYLLIGLLTKAAFAVILILAFQK